MARLTIRPALLSLAARCLDNLLPRHCVLCGLPGGPGNLCPSCRADLPRPGNVCTVCALPVGNPGDTVCGPCLRKPPPWDRVEAALVYRFPVDQLVCRFKFGRDFACGHLLGCEMLAAIHGTGLQRPDLVLPVPLHRVRHVSRTFNQADLLARQVGRALGVPVHSSLMSRVRRTRAQSGLDAAGRKRNTRGAFRCHRRAAGVLSGRHVALVDDVMTTGATLLECTRTLRRAGVARISLWVAARAPAG
jgi:ComF family protein